MFTGSDVVISVHVGVLRFRKNDDVFFAFIYWIIFKCGLSENEDIFDIDAEDC